MDKSIFWYDFESTGIDPRCDRPLQVAGVRTNEQLEEIGEPLCIDCRLAEDTLPAPMACLVTGIGPQRMMRGLPEAQFIRLLHDQMAAPGTCSAGYNNLRFDDEMTRFSLYRNFYNPYAREWQGGNSRWDLLDALRTAHALRPEGITWPEQDGLTSLRLELLTAANGIAHGQAHDALADVRATIAMARLLRTAQPRLYEYLYSLRSKQRVCQLIDLQRVRPLVHVSGRFGRERKGLAVVLPLGWHPSNRNALIVWDLDCDPGLLTDLSPEDIRARLYTRREDLPEGQERPGLKLVHINKCPVLADVNVLREQDIERLELDMPRLRANADTLATWRAAGQAHLASIFANDAAPARQQTDDCDTQLYEGFVSDADNRLLPAIREADGRSLIAEQWPLKDQRLADLLVRYRARNFPESLSAEEQARWTLFCRDRLEGTRYGAPITLEAFHLEIARLLPTVEGPQKKLLEDWKNYADSLARKLGATLTAAQ
ncbi:exodeoxyribonuclease I [Halopseudomonas nanhaiensis]|uniref:exodeoxyribonuclease I n=1 Tax=Halopseudomonas nanhaiensis TaxID=2830842 RepID=UPI001CBCBBB6|nr:exodeoxyribonuclease I [Halopseudomonas nanhaiensis]UAW99321.1 exodeoxyribonuclease I [Halopseudomonas nanhaiensis]